MPERSSVSLKKDKKEVNQLVVSHGEHGGSTAKFLLVMIALFLVGYGGYNYITVWYQSSHYKDKMTEIITQAYAMPNQLSSPDLIQQKLRKIGDYDDVPANAVITVEKKPGGVEARTVFMREVSILPFNMYKYKYQFDYTAKPPTLLEIK